MKVFSVLAIITAVSSAVTTFSRAGAAMDGAATNVAASVKKGMDKVGPALKKAGEVTWKVTKEGAALATTGAVMGVGLAGGFLAVDSIANRRRRVDPRLIQ